jgi:hypothetical protein
MIAVQTNNEPATSGEEAAGMRTKGEDIPPPGGRLSLF